MHPELLHAFKCMQEHPSDSPLMHPELHHAFKCMQEQPSDSPHDAPELHHAFRVNELKLLRKGETPMPSMTGARETVRSRLLHPELHSAFKCNKK
jgi:hypothetical protein